MDVGNRDVCAFARQQQSHLPANAAASADHKHNLAAELRLGRHALKLRLLERPVLDTERLRARKSDVIVKALELGRLLGAARLRQRVLYLAVFQRDGARHHVDRIDKELRCNTSFFLVLSEPE